MSLKSLPAIAAVAFAAAACTPMQWIKPDAAPDQVEQDAIACQQDAWREARSRAWFYAPFGAAPFRDQLGRQMFAWPHGPYAGDPFGDPYLEEGRLTQFCMRNKGYELVPQPAK
jgi:hypothetical protein